MAATQKSTDYEFLPDAMLPAWVVTDRDLVVRHRNNFAFQLLTSVNKADLFFNNLLSLRLDGFPTEEHESLWKCILDPNYPNNFENIGEALRILEGHVVILDKFKGDNESDTADLLVEQLKRVAVNTSLREAVVPYIIRPVVELIDSEFVMGIKISPPQGLKLIRPVELENSIVEYVDIVMAYQLLSDWSSDRKLRRIGFLGTQPAIHDATFRHRLWEKAKLEEQAEITQFLSHAFKTPISNIQSMTRELQQSELSDHYRDVCEKLEVQVGDLSNLSDLILFINTSAPIPTTLCGSQPKDSNVWEYVHLDEIKDEIEKTIQSIHKGSTRDPLDQRKIELLAASDGESLTGADYSRLAERLIDAGDLADRTTFGLLLMGDLLENDSDKAAEIARKVRTTFVNLLLPELFRNAIKYADPAAPEVKVRICFSASADTLEINIFNNGPALTASQFKNVRTELANKPGEKRRALGLLLNLRAAEILGWKLQWKAPAQPGTHLTLRIPFTA